jgi:hypothetical protein
MNLSENKGKDDSSSETGLFSSTSSTGNSSSSEDGVGDSPSMAYCLGTLLINPSLQIIHPGSLVH